MGSSINVADDSAPFAISAGQVKVINAGFASMNVNTTEDDPDGALGGGQITLRDAIETGNEGNFPPLPTGTTPAITFITTDPQTGELEPLSGTISLQAVLPAIANNYNIDGPGASILTVQGQGGSTSSYSGGGTSSSGGGTSSSGGGMFNPAGSLDLTAQPQALAKAGPIYTIDVGKMSAISGQTIKNGNGGVVNNGILKLNNDVIRDNTRGGNGGGIYNGTGSLKLSGDQILWNNAANGGGLYNAGGTVTITGSTLFNNNKSLVGVGGGIYNAPGGTVKASGGTVISTNSAPAGSGGGVANQGQFFMTGGRISGNTVNAAGAGGGVINLSGSMRLLGVQIMGNSASEGGGIYTSGKLLMGNATTITDNKASSDGAGIYVKGGTATMLGRGTGTTVGGGITYNTAQRDGGGIYVYGGQLTLQSGVHVSNNTAVGNGGVVAWGGGIFIKSGKVTVSGGSISYNTAAGWSGGGIYNLAGTLTLKENVNVTDNNANTKGGGIYLATNSTTTFDGAFVGGNWTNGNKQTTGWGVYWQFANGVGATVNPNPPGPPNNKLTDNDDPGGNPVKAP